MLKSHFDQITDYLDIGTIAEDAIKQCDYLITVSGDVAAKTTRKVKLAIEILFEGTFATNAVGCCLFCNKFPKRYHYRN